MNPVRDSTDLGFQVQSKAWKVPDDVVHPFLLQRIKDWASSARDRENGSRAECHDDDGGTRAVSDYV